VRLNSEETSEAAHPLFNQITLVSKRVKKKKIRNYFKYFTGSLYIREIIFGKRRQQQFWQITTDIETLPNNTTWYVMTYIPGVKYKEIGNLFGIRTWVEYGLNLHSAGSSTKKIIFLTIRAEEPQNVCL
jgi:SRSO17 transposase